MNQGSGFNQKKIDEELLLTQFCFDHASIGIFRIDSSNARILNVNKNVCDTLGYTEEELCSMDVFDIDPDFPKEKWNEHIKKIRTLSTHTIETTHQKKNGTTFPVEVVLNVIEFNGTEYHLAFAKDISDRKDSEKERLKIKTQLVQAQKMEAIGTLAGGIAHDFNNILSGIVGYSQLAEMDINIPAKVKSHLSQILKGAQRATELVQQILTFSRQSEYKKQVLNLSSLVKEALKLLRPSIPSTIAIKKNIYSKAAIMADPTQIHQVIMNLCTNAYQVMHEKGGVLTVGLEEIDVPGQDNLPELNMAPGKYLRLEVSDTGDGIDSETMDKIFEPYFTTKKTDRGTGLGLSVVHGIVKEHKGYLKVSSTRGQGSCFYVFFPVSEKEIPLMIPKNPEAAQIGGAESIMFVDDEESIRTSAQSFLEDQGYKISSFNNGEDALQAFKKDPCQFDIIVTDMTMPALTGDKLAAAILEIRPDLPIILCSGYSHKFSKEKIQKIGISSFLQKPVLLKNLAEIIREKLDKKQLF